MVPVDLLMIIMAGVTACGVGRKAIRYHSPGGNALMKTDVSSLTLEEWFPPQSDSAPPGTLSDVRGHLGLSRLEVG